jgi:serine/threonine protein phosphatase 1
VQSLTPLLDGQHAQSMLWDLYPDGHPGGHRTRHVVHGHHQFADGPKVFSGRTDLDTFAWFTGRLVVGVFDDNEPGGAIDFLDVVGGPA